MATEDEIELEKEQEKFFHDMADALEFGEELVEQFDPEMLYECSLFFLNEYNRRARALDYPSPALESKRDSRC